MNETLDAKTNEKELLGKSNISNPVKNLDLIIRLKTLAAKADLKAEQDKIVKLQTHDLSYFFDKHFFDHGFENRFIYQPTLNALELKKTKTRALNMLLAGNQKWYILLNLQHYILLSCIA